ncbi:GGDEF domain-containing protein [Acidicapsa ligni]|uniref:GGDEF domain-containing protein n=1 Tax=Acidicapsa ligni TaxID=542300 RepID=UPI0021DFDA34|nr:diguanylate cyclase [Acidicapsa ligni]
MPSNFAPLVLLASPDASLTFSVRAILESFGSQVIAVGDGDTLLAAIGTHRPQNFPSILLLDAQLPGIADGMLLAAVHDSGIHRQSALAVIVGQVVANGRAPEELIARLQEGVIDDIVPRNADAAGWSIHLSTMKRGHQLYCELEEMREAASIEVQHDRLTGLFNRETMLSILFRETDRVQRLHGALSLMLFDLDDFGHWNGEFGVDVCDQLLQQVAARTGRTLRSYDLLGRLGKDEFLLALPGCSTVNAVMLADRMRMEVFDELFTVGNGENAVQVQLTACFGITASGGRSPVVVLREAERALAQAKESGPDTIRCASEARLTTGAGDAPLLLSGGHTVSW